MAVRHIKTKHSIVDCIMFCAQAQTVEASNDNVKGPSAVAPLPNATNAPADFPSGESSGDSGDEAPTSGQGYGAEGHTILACASAPVHGSSRNYGGVRRPLSPSHVSSAQCCISMAVLQLL